MMMKNDLKTNEIVNFLDIHDKKTIENLKIEFPDFAIFLKPGIVLTDEYSDEAYYKFKVKLVTSGLNSMQEKGEYKLQELQKKRKTLNNIQFISQIVTFISGSTLLAMINSESIIKYVAPTLVLIASILTIWSKNRAEPFLGGNESIYKFANELIVLTSKARSLLSELELVSQLFNLEKAVPLVDSANNIAEEMDIIIKKAS